MVFDFLLQYMAMYLDIVHSLQAEHIFLLHIDKLSKNLMLLNFKSIHQMGQALPITVQAN